MEVLNFVECYLVQSSSLLHTQNLDLLCDFSDERRCEPGISKSGLYWQVLCWRRWVRVRLYLPYWLISMCILQTTCQREVNLHKPFN